MSRSKILEDHITISLSILLLVHVSNIEAGASSNPKNLVNLYTNAPNDNLNLTSLNQFQNGYQYRQNTAKYAALDRHDPTPPSQSESIFEHLSGDLSNTNAYDYTYQDNRDLTYLQDCKGRVKLNSSRGYITDGPGSYETNLQCTWFIDSGRDNATIRFQFHKFNTECNYDFLYIFDGDSIYSPLIAALSGELKDFSSIFNKETNGLEHTISNHDIQTKSTYSTTTPLSSNNSSTVSSITDSSAIELKTRSGKAFVYFHSDTAQSISGFHLTYSIDSCSLDCSNRGECDHTTLTCKCISGYYGEGCQYAVCPNNCTSIEHGICSKDKSCVCKEGFQGADCSISIYQDMWISLPSNASTDNIPSRAFHQAVVVEGLMWIIGGKTPSLSNPNSGLFLRKKTSVVSSYDLQAKKWSSTILYGFTGLDHLAELSGHSVAAKGQKIFIYGGIALNNTVLDALTVLDTKTWTLTSLTTGKNVKNPDDEFSAPIPVVGHTANIIDGHMYVFLGYNPLYGYLNLVQKFNLANNSWSFVEKKGSSIVGSIGHSSSYDPVGRLVYIYGGHHAQRSNHLYSFDPYTERWTYLQAGPSPRYYHSSVILNNQLLVLGGNSYNTSHKSDHCFQHTYLKYDLTCSRSANDYLDQKNSTVKSFDCRHKCWQMVEDSQPSILKRHGHSVVNYNDALVLFGGFNGFLMDDIRIMNITKCELYRKESDCLRNKLTLTCYWDSIESKCIDQRARSITVTTTTMSPISTYDNCTNSDIKSLERICQDRETCSDCLSTNVNCVWCGYISRCQYDSCKSPPMVSIRELDSCYHDPVVGDGLANQLINVVLDMDNEKECRRVDNCYLCNTKTNCSWTNDVCAYNSPSTISGQSASLGSTQAPSDDFSDVPGNTKPVLHNSVALSPNSSRFMIRFDPFNKTSLLSALTNNLLLLQSPYNPCPESPCYTRRSCGECITPKCIWCSTSERCMDSSAYFAYHAMGQCMHYVAHASKCSVADCSDIQSCEECLTNPKCGWLNDISGTGKGKCMKGTSLGPSNLSGNDSSTPSLMSWSVNDPTMSNNTTALALSNLLPNWYYSTCPSCQCNGHSSCKPDGGGCIQPCQDNTEGEHCEKCTTGYFGDPINGGTCLPCRCNGHSQLCDKETGKCYCSTKGIIGHTCNRCDDQNHYIGDPLNPNNGTCYYNLTTDYQYTFNFSKSEDHFYSYINFINVPLKKDSDVDFTIACSRLALVNITLGTSYKNRKPIHSSIECGSFRMRFPYDRHMTTEANYSFFIHVYKFQSPFILQIAFSQHRTLYLPQFFFTFSCCFLFFFALSSVIWKIKHEYDSYVRRQRQFIEMEQMASRPFSTILLEIFRPFGGKSQTTTGTNATATTTYTSLPPEPTPISFEPCFGGNVGVLSLFVQLPGRPNLAIGSALVTLNDETNTASDEPCKQLEKRTNF